MSHPRRRAPRTPLRRSAYTVLGFASLLVVGALVSGSTVLVGVAAVLALALAVAAAACLVQDALAGRRAAAAANATLAACFTDLFAAQATEHQHELDRLVAYVAALSGQVQELTSRNSDLAVRNTDLELAAALAAVGRTTAATPHEQGRLSTVVTLPVQQFDHPPVQRARASGE